MKSVCVWYCTKCGWYTESRDEAARHLGQRPYVGFRDDYETTGRPSHFCLKPEMVTVKANRRPASPLTIEDAAFLTEMANHHRAGRRLHRDNIIDADRLRDIAERITTHLEATAPKSAVPSPSPESPRNQ